MADRPDTQWMLEAVGGGPYDGESLEVTRCDREGIELSTGTYDYCECDMPCAPDQGAHWHWVPRA